MQIVINIPNSTFTDLKKKQNRTEVDVAVLNGVPLPKGHGRLIDADALWKKWVFDTIGKQEIDDAPTIIEAESEE